MAKISRKMTADKILIQTPKFQVIEREFSNGAASMICHPGAAVILPFLDSSRICMITNHRKTVDANLVELPAGTLDLNERPMETAQRELAEETGFIAEHMEPLFDYYVSPGIMDEKMHAFLATQLKRGEQNLMPDETIEPMIVYFSEALNWIKTGRIQDAKTIATLLYYDKFGNNPSGH